MADDDSPPGGSRSQRRKSEAVGMYVPVAALAAIVVAFAIFLFNRIDTQHEDVLSRMDAARAARNVQVSALERDVVRLQEQQANTAAVLSEIKGYVRTILEKLDEINRERRNISPDAARHQ